MPSKNKEIIAANSRRHYERNRDAVIAGKKARIVRNGEYVRGIKATTPCADCGHIYHPAAMDFHHTRDKLATLAQLIHLGRSIASLDREIAKCVALCANCHRIRHHGAL